MINKIAESLVFLNAKPSFFKPSLADSNASECNELIFELFAPLFPDGFIGLHKFDEDVFVAVLQIIANHCHSNGEYEDFNGSLLSLSKEHYLYFLEKLKELGIEEPVEWRHGFCMSNPSKEHLNFMKIILSECVGHVANFFCKSVERPKNIDFKDLVDDSEKNRKYYYVGNSAAMVETHYGEYLFLDLEDNSVVPTIVKTGWWEPWIDHLINAVLEPGMVAVDAGANFGYHTNLIAKIIREKGHLYAFEANPHLITLLKRSIWVNGFSPRVSLFSAALGDKVEDVKFVFDREQVGGGGVNHLTSQENKTFQLFSDHKKIHWGSWNQNYPPIEKMVRMTNIDSALSQEVDELNFIHMDIEGSEPLAIIGGKNLIARSKDLVMILEWSSNSKSEIAYEAFSFLKSLQYKFYMIVPPHGKNAYSTPPTLKRLTLDELMSSSHCDIFVSK